MRHRHKLNIKKKKRKTFNKIKNWKISFVIKHLQMKNGFNFNYFVLIEEETQIVFCQISN